MTADALSEYFEHCPGLLFIASADGVIDRCSRSLARRFESRLSEAATLASLAADGERETVEAFLGALAETDEAVTCVFGVPDQAGGTTKVRCEARRSSTGSIHGTLEPVAATGAGSAELEIRQTLLRTVMDTLDIVLWAVDPTGKFVFHEGKALATAGLTPGQFLGMNVFDIYPPAATAPIQEALYGTASHYKSEVHGVNWETWNIPLKNEAGVTEYCAGLTLDITATVKSQAELEHQLQTIQEQRRAIQALSAPLIEVWDKVLTVPLIGVLDDEQTNKLIERLLAEVSRSGAAYVILDLTGVEALDTSIASHILRLLASLRLLGVEGLVTGVSPYVAQTMVGLGVELGSVGTHRNLRDALRHCMRALLG
ncbi:STAS domain-containing protein [Enhygromyxa salina]|uniref:RsbT co-antagonist protein RsbRA n=1 Tax=Enhygromyxa salina TaxID=215803 RepID=A0A2S9Y841_9BACT|nr:STAS domain-containing protein [Enhygromyxa salina]PRQ01288.1 RsbT co-antagonist protein RsbRA [Enhygromyxa salina]